MTDHQLALVLEPLARVPRLHDGLAAGDEGVVGSVSDVGLRREARLAAEQRSGLPDVHLVVEPGGVEGPRDDGDQQSDRRESPVLAGPPMGAERATADLLDLVALEDTVGCVAICLVSDTAHDIRSPGPGLVVCRRASRVAGLFLSGQRPELLGKSFEEGRTQQLHGVEAHARAIGPASAGIGVGPRAEARAVGDSDVRLPPSEVLYMQLGFGHGVEGETDVALRAITDRPSERFG